MPELGSKVARRWLIHLRESVAYPGRIPHSVPRVLGFNIGSRRWPIGLKLKFQSRRAPFTRPGAAIRPLRRHAPTLIHRLARARHLSCPRIVSAICLSTPAENCTFLAVENCTL